VKILGQKNIVTIEDKLKRKIAFILDDSFIYVEGEGDNNGDEFKLINNRDFDELVDKIADSILKDADLKVVNNMEQK
jgi:hypothetical protein